MSQTVPLADNRPLNESLTEAHPPPGRLLRLEYALERASDWLNPITIKEARQSLKSRQFLLSFFVLLMFAWGWSILGTTLWASDWRGSASGPHMMFGYFVCLAFPLMVIVPFAAFRSLLAEREDGTYDLLSITTLRARQIIGGKLATAMLQVLVFLSAVAPCVAFTYVLRGVDLPSMLLHLLLLVLISFALASLGLLLATFTRTRHTNVALSVVLLGALFASYFGYCGSMGEASRFSFRVSYDEPDFWPQLVTAFAFFGSFVWLALAAATAAITFPSENRSTFLRWIMLFQQTLLIGLTVYLATRRGMNHIEYVHQAELVPIFIMALWYWAIMGSLLCAESGFITHRVQRQLPRYFVSRALFTWLNPGPRTGYIFAVGNLGILALLIALESATIARPSWGPPRNLVGMVVTGWGYLAIYLAVGTGVLQMLRRMLKVTLAAGPLVNFLIVVAGALIPIGIDAGINRFPGYSLLHLPNVVWTLAEVLNSPGSGAEVLVPAVGLICFGSALFVSLRDVTQQRIALPARVEEELKATQRSTAPPVPSSPWDEPSA